MTKRSLSPVQVELLHHIELSDAGWQQRAIDQLVLAACLEASGELGESEILQRISDIHEPVGAELVRRSIARLCSAKDLLEIHRGH